MTDSNVLLAKAQAFVDRKYVARADERQKSMGLAYVEAERQDLAREIARFAVSNAPSPAELKPDLVDAIDAIRDILAANSDFRKGMPDGWEGDPLQDACDKAANLLLRLVG